MSRPLVDAVLRRPLDVPPVWVMRQAGRYLPEYREVRSSCSFQQAVSTPEIAAELTLQPIRRFAMDGAVIFADIMTPLEAMGVEMDFAPGPRLRPHTLEEVSNLGALLVDRVGFVAETVRRVRSEVADEVAVIGFCGAPVTLLAYLLEGGGSKDFLQLRRALRAEPKQARHALDVIAGAMNTYLQMQIEAGADVVQVFDSWVGILDRQSVREIAVPAARATLSGLSAPTIYFGPHAPHALDLFGAIGADCYGVDWRVPIDEAWALLGEVAIQGNLDPATLLTDPDSISQAVEELIARVGGRPGHVVNLGHGIDKDTPPENVATLVKAVRNRA